MIYLVDERDNLIKSTYTDSVDFSISGHYPLHVNDTLTGVSANSNNAPAALIAAKLQAYKDARTITLDDTFQEEFLTAAPATIDTVNSSGFVIGKNKRTGLLPGGHIMTTNTAFGGSRSKVFCDWYGFTFYSKPSPISPSIPAVPNPLYMNYDPLSGLFSFQPSTFTVELYQSGGPLINALSANKEVTLGAPFGPGNVTLKITNTSSVFYHLSDIVMIAGS